MYLSNNHSPKLGHTFHTVLIFLTYLCKAGFQWLLWLNAICAKINVKQKTKMLCPACLLCTVSTGYIRLISNCDYLRMKSGPVSWLNMLCQCLQCQHPILENWFQPWLLGFWFTCSIPGKETEDGPNTNQWGSRLLYSAWPNPKHCRSFGELISKWRNHFLPASFPLCQPDFQISKCFKRNETNIFALNLTVFFSKS